MKTETRPDLAPWPLLRELGPEFFEVAVRAQVSWHGPTAAWAIALDLGVRALKVADALREMRRAGEVIADTSSGDLRWVIADPSALPLDLWTFTLGWLARRAFAGRYVVTCPGCAGDGYTERSWLGTDEELEAAEASPAAVRAEVYDGEGGYYRIDYEPLVPGTLWRITTRTWCSSCYGDDEGELGKLELTIAELIGLARAGGSRADGGVRDHLAVLGDMLELEGNPWGPWIAAHLGGSVVARQEHEEALAAAVRGLAPAFEQLRGTMVNFAAAAEQDEAPAPEPARRHGPVGDQLRRRLGRGRW